ncbi:MAG: DNA replication/repair protein RecF [Alphaproteobacteria bacterium]|nr:DNA replication/repair protein RecF [Alphaproteobacteria bacterium]
MSYLTQLTLHNFRCYAQGRLDNVQNGLVVLCGPNGAGKTNILEAVSMLSPGRGLRGASVQTMQRQDGQTPWAIFSEVATRGGAVKLGTGFEPATGRRIVRINGVDAKSQKALSDYLSCLWLTPQMDRLFIDGPATRRKFLDRLIFTYDAGHAGRLTRYENAMRQRSKLLQEGKEKGTPDPAWLEGLETQMAQTGVAICAARLDFVQKLQTYCDQADAGEEQFFPKAQLRVQGTAEELLQKSPAIEVEQMLSYQLEQSRGQDALKGGAATGPHKSDLAVTYVARGMAADQCSTGEQKALLIGIILAHGRMMAAEKGMAPIMLLDEVVAHLDQNRRAALFELLIALGGQVWMSGTDPVLFEEIKTRAQFFYIEQAQILSAARGQAA